jgi:hypothetical protein
MLYDLNSLENSIFSSYYLIVDKNLWWDNLKQNERVDEEHSRHD